MGTISACSDIIDNRVVVNLIRGVDDILWEGNQRENDDDDDDDDDGADVAPAA